MKNRDFWGEQGSINPFLSKRSLSGTDCLPGASSMYIGIVSLCKYAMLK